MLATTLAAAFLDKAHEPGDGAAAVAGGREPHQFQRGLREGTHREAGIVEVIVVGDIADHGAGRKRKRFTIKVVGGLLTLPGIVEVGRGAAVVQLGDTNVDVDIAILARVEDILAVGGKGNLVVIEAEVLLLIGGRTPPAGGVLNGFTAAEVGGGFLVPNPGAHDRIFTSAAAVAAGFLAGKDELPGDGTAAIAGRRVPHQREGVVVDGLYVEAAVRDVVVVGDVREQGTVFQLEDEGVAFHLKLVRRGLCLDGHAVVGIFLECAVRAGGDAGVHIHGAGCTRIEGIVPVAGEAQAVVVHAEVLLLVGLGRPPLGGVLHGSAAGHVRGLVVVEAPHLGAAAGNLADVLVEVHDGVVHVEGLFHVVRRDAVGVHRVEADGVVAGAGEDALIGIAGLVFGPLALFVGQDPHGDDPLFVHGEGDLVGGLVHRDDRGISRRAGDAGLGGVFEAFLGTGGQHQGGRGQEIC